MNRPEIDLSPEELWKLQQEDETLATVREAANGAVSTVGPSFFKRDGLIYRQWTPQYCMGTDMQVKQLVPPKTCRQVVLQLAHKVHLAWHLGKNKTVQRILQHFYWPTMYRDVAQFSRSCPKCQKAATRKVLQAPLIPLLVISEPFEWIAMNIVGPLPVSRHGNCYVLVVCDYATRYPEAVPLRTMDAE